MTSCKSQQLKVTVVTREQGVRERYSLLTFRRGSGSRRADLNLQYVVDGRWGKQGLHHGLNSNCQKGSSEQCEIGDAVLTDWFINVDY